VAYWAATELRRTVSSAYCASSGWSFEVYLPLVRERRVRYGRRVQIMVPLFPG
jgi:hypothetical protein